MRSLLMFFRSLLLLLFFTGVAKAQSVEVWTGTKLYQELKQQNDTVYVFNFWATWCKPCIEELPEFEIAQKHWSGKPVRFVFISLDFLSKREAQLLPFVAKNLSWAEVVQLDAGNPNEWIPEVDSTWSGAIPATLFWSTQGRVLREEGLNYQQINTIIQSLTP
jgi:thiol-disulfide isomerase/thioredoxin